MPQTVSSTLLGTYKSIARAAIVCNANGTTSLDVLTVAHQLAACPDIMRAVLRSLIGATSGNSPELALRSWDASQAIFDSPAGAGAGVLYARFDIVCEITQSARR